MSFVFWQAFTPQKLAVKKKEGATTASIDAFQLMSLPASAWARIGSTHAVSSAPANTTGTFGRALKAVKTEASYLQ